MTIKETLDSIRQKLKGEKGFVFIDSVDRPYHVRMWNGSPWMFYWHPDNHWVSLRKVTQADVWRFHEKAISEERAQIYHDADRCASEIINRACRESQAKETL